MSAETSPTPPLIATPAQLNQAAAALLQQPILGVDTESNSLFVYFEQVCLIQISTPQTDLMIDPLALPELGALSPLFSAPQIEKVFHAAEYDLICLRRDFGFQFANLFDTMVAARILGYTEVGLGALLQAHFGVQADKRHQRSNWGQRPLPENLLAYARLDTHYLVALRDILKEALLKSGLWPLAQEDFQRLAYLPASAWDSPPAATGDSPPAVAGDSPPTVVGDLPPAEGNNPATNQNRASDPWRIKGAYDLHPQQAAVLKELCRYQDKTARQLNRPRFKVISDHTLLQVAVHSPRDLPGLARVPGMTPGQVQRHGSQLLQAVRNGLKAKPIHPPRTPRPDERYLQRLERLRLWRKETGQRLNVPSDVVLPRDLLNELAKRHPLDEAALAEVMHDVPWRLEHFGGEILRTIRKQ